MTTEPPPPETPAGEPPVRQRVRLRIKGRVQGVGFRYAAVDEAMRLGLTGWVRNTPDGDVELVAEGHAELVRRLIDWSHAGPPGALVTGVDQQLLPYAGDFDAFRIRR
ncbi:acylphosphatase [Candidatus Binatia bacterium]|nr:acylphosphatase [Candidatus Binatia bacterium]